MLLKNIYQNNKGALFLILAGALAIRIVMSFILYAELRSDSLVYDELAKSIAFHGEYSFERKTTALLIAGYPLFLAAIYKFIGTEQIYVKIIQSIIDTGTCFMFFLVLRRFFNVKYSLTGLAVFAFFPSNVLYAQTVLTEPLFGFFAMLLLYLLIFENPYKHSFLIGIVWGIAVFIRSSFALSVLIYPFYLIWNRRKVFEGYKSNRLKKAFQFSFIFLFGFTLILTPWLIRNKIELGSFTLATQGGFTFWSGSNPEATGTWYHMIEETHPLFNEQDEVKRDREFYKLGFDFALNNPHKFLITGIKKVGYLFSSERMILLYFTEDESKARTSTEVYKSVNPVYSAIVNLPYFAVMLFGLWGLLMFKRINFYVAAFVISWIVTIFLFVALSRYHYVLIPFFTIGVVNFLVNRKMMFKSLSKFKIITGIACTLFFLGVWFSEFYLMYK